MRDTRPLDEVFGISAPAGPDALAAEPMNTRGRIGGQEVSLPLLEAGLTTTTGGPIMPQEQPPALIAHSFGVGQAMWLNFPFSAYNKLRADKTEWAFTDLLQGLLTAEGMPPVARITSPDGRARCLERVVFADGDLRYLALQQDILVRGIPEQSVTVDLPEPAWVYDLRAGKPVSERPARTWQTTVSRGVPRLFSLLPYRVTGLSAQLLQAAGPADPPTESPQPIGDGQPVRFGQTVQIQARLTASAPTLGFHVIHLAVFAPGAETPHRQYSANIDCPAGVGTTTIPFALNDPEGVWRLVLTDVATGTQSESRITLAP